MDLGVKSPTVSTTAVKFVTGLMTQSDLYEITHRDMGGNGRGTERMRAAGTCV